MEPGHDLQDHPLWPWVQQVWSSRGRELMRRHGAQDLAIAWVQRPDGEQVPGLVFSVASDDLDRAAAIPTTIEVVDTVGRRRRIRTRVEVSAPDRE